MIIYYACATPSSCPFLSSRCFCQSVCRAGARVFFTHFGCNEIRDNAFITFQIDVAHMAMHVWYVWTMNRFGNVPLFKMYCEIESFTIITISSASFSPSRSPIHSNICTHRTFRSLDFVHFAFNHYAVVHIFDGFRLPLSFMAWFTWNIDLKHRCQHSHTPKSKNNVGKKINNDNKEEEKGEMIQQQIPLKMYVYGHTMHKYKANGSSAPSTNSRVSVFGGCSKKTKRRNDMDVTKVT